MTTRKKTSFPVSISKEERLSKVKSAFEGDKNAIDELICLIASRRANFTIMQMRRMVGEMNPEVWFCKGMPNE